MHIPDGFLDAKTAVAAGVLAAAGLGFALRQVRRHLPPKRIPLMGLAAAFVFAAQMLNFPVIGGTSGHLVGAVLAAVLLGPSAAVIVISAVLIVQALLFADGGITAIGANIFNMALIGGVGGWGIYRLVSRMFAGLRGQIMAASFASWCAIVLGSIACAGELALSGTVAWGIVLPAMACTHMLIGIGEAVITALVLVSVAKVRPELMDQQAASAPVRYHELAIYGLLICLGLALFVSPLASKWPDGLARAAEMLGFKEKETAKSLIAAPLPDYRIPWIGSGTVATSLAGAVGTVIVFCLSFGLARALTAKADTEKVAKNASKP